MRTTWAVDPAFEIDSNEEGVFLTYQVGPERQGLHMSSHDFIGLLRSVKPLLAEQLLDADISRRKNTRT